MFGPGTYRLPEPRPSNLHPGHAWGWESSINRTLENNTINNTQYSWQTLATDPNKAACVFGGVWHWVAGGGSPSLIQPQELLFQSKISLLIIELTRTSLSWLLGWKGVMSSAPLGSSSSVVINLFFPFTYLEFSSWFYQWEQYSSGPVF